MSEGNPIRCFRSQDCDPGALQEQTVAVVGYGNLGRSVALNLHDSGCKVLVGNIGDEYRTVAAEDGFTSCEIAEAVAGAEITLVLLPDDVIPDVFPDAIAPALRAGSAVCFASGYALAYGLVDPPAGVDVLVIAPRMLGDEVRRAYTEGFFSYISVEHDASGQAEPRLLALADAVGSLRRGAVALSAKQEALLDLFVEQTFGPYLGMALQTAFQVGTEAGLPSEAMALELYMSGEMARTLQAFADQGFFRAVGHHGTTAAYGGVTRLSGVDTEGMLAFFRQTLADIRDGGFAERLQQERDAGYPTLEAVREFTDSPSPITDAEQNLRKEFPVLRATGDADGDG
ncbi:NAD(P)-binding domain-containing protein [Haloactinomyces albus]|uniref:Ketol-acid reductoisomerase type 1 n=1 Tax=Haloactinomyces albus TaxID=1352928 RepID=A0AAE3ZAZ9_9ACTN|nr:NAD(P)-binding domain-containing protein [Haloactinomyces albus]MDR7299902.1 ketol-acid reductoisomerase [Haloactinomyces albus]